MNKVAIMQPYVFPYIGYFQLIQAVDTFVFYDDVNFIKQGWINRNRILVNGHAHLFTIPVEQISSFKEIKDVQIHERNFNIWRDKFFKTLSQSYKRASFFGDVMKLIDKILMIEGNKIGELAQYSVTVISNYLELNKEMMQSSAQFPETKGLDKADRLIAICQKLNSNHYVNPIGGVELYSKEYFSRRNIALSFIKSSDSINYLQQGNLKFEPWLSIIDVMMFNSPEQIRQMLNQYELT